MRCLMLLLMLTAAATAQNLAGTWKLVSAGEWRPNGEMLHPYGKAPSGMLIYDAKGNVSLQLQYDGKGPAGESYFSYFGTYKADPQNGSVYHAIKGSSNENLRGATLTCFVTLDGNRLTLGLLPDMVNGEMRLRSQVWERIP